MALSLWLTGAAVAGPFAAQQLLDRVVARVGDNVITMTDLEAAIGFGILDPAPRAGDPLQQLVDLRLIMLEMMRRPPAAPDAEAVETELARLRAHAGDRLSTLMASTGIDQDRLRGIAREALRLEAYLVDRVPLVPASDPDAELYYRTNPDAFLQNGSLLPFSDVAAEARRAAAEERRATRIAGWLITLRNRTEVAIVQ